MKNQTAFVALGLVALVLSMGLVSMGATAEDTTSETPDETFSQFPCAGEGWMRAGIGGMGLEDRMEAMKEKLGLPEDATQEDIMNAMMQNRETLMEEHMTTVKEKLGLPEDATDEEVQDALNQWREENHELIMASGMQMRARHGKPDMPGMKGMQGMHGMRSGWMASE